VVVTRSVVLVEGARDRVALEGLALRRGLDLARHGVEVLAMGGATEIRRYVGRLIDVRLAGLCDAAEEGYFARARAHAPGGLEVFVCDPDLEVELIRALGVDRVEGVVEAEGELPSWRRFQKQPAQRGRSIEDQLHRFMGTRSGRKAQYARSLVDALDLDRVPRPLDAVLAWATNGG
jgi:hypothetical protein